MILRIGRKKEDGGKGSKRKKEIVYRSAKEVESNSVCSVVPWVAL